MSSNLISEVTCTVVKACGNLNPPVMYLSDVLSGTAEIANLCGKRNTPQYISGLAGIEIECKVNTVLHHIHIHSSVVGTCCRSEERRVGEGCGRRWRR